MFKKNWSLQQQGVFLVRLGNLLDKGYSLSQAIEFLEIQEPLSHRHDLQRCLSRLRSGFPFYKSLEPLHFHTEAIGYLFFAEQHGDLPRGITEAGRMLLHKSAYLQCLRKASSYPLFLFCFMMMMLTMIQHVLLPQFIHLSSSFPIHRFSISRLLVQTVSFIPSLFIFVCITILVFLLVYFAWFRKLSTMAQINIWMKIPLVRTFMKLYYTHLFALQFSHLLHGGLSIYESLQVFERQEKVPFLREEGRWMKEQLVKGTPLDTIIVSRPCYEQELTLVIRHGQSNGELANELFHYSQFVFQAMEERIEKWMRLIQPILLSLIGLLVVCMYLAILLPMFETMNEL